MWFRVPLLVFLWVCMSSQALLAASPVRAEVVLDGSADPPGDRIDVAVLFRPGEGPGKQRGQVRTCPLFLPRSQRCGEGLSSGGGGRAQDVGSQSGSAGHHQDDGRHERGHRQSTNKIQANKGDRSN